ncbi:MAG: hypothetical protein ACAI37_16370 [Chthoniobacter sp.]
MSWIALTPEDIDAAKAGAQVAALRTAALAGGQVDPITDAITRVTLQIRIAVRSCERNRLDSDETLIPGELKSLAQRMVYRELQQRLNVSRTALALTEDDRMHWDKDITMLRDIARCDLVVSAPDNPTSDGVQAAGSIRVVSGARRQVSRDRMRGLT